MVSKNKKTTKKFTPLLNENIPFSQVLLVGEEKIVLSKQEALQQAQASNLSLLCVAPQANPPVCKLVDYQKYLFELNKKKSKKENINKEVRISFAISENDLLVKLNKIYRWLDQGTIVKVNLLMKGREKTQQELGREKCQKIISQLKSYSPAIELQGNIHSHLGSFYFSLGKKL